MIVDELSRTDRYQKILPQLPKCLVWMVENGTSSPTGIHAMDGDHLVVHVNEYETKPESESRFEAHRRYVDFQVLLEGAERFEYAPIERLNPTTEYSVDKDVQFFEGNGSAVILTPGSFVIAFPEDGHRGGIVVDAPKEVRKLVFKIELGRS